MKYLTAGFAVLLFAVAACSDGSIVGVEEATLNNPDLAYAGKREVKMLPLVGTWDFWADPTGTPIPCFLSGNATPVGEFISDNFMGVGYLTLLGKSTTIITFNGCDVNADGSLLGVGTATFTGANGDAFNMNFVGDFYLDGPFNLTEVIIAGGTGRFDGAVGQVDGGGAIDVSTGVGTFWLDGNISSVGSTK